MEYKINKATVFRTIVNFVALLNAILIMAGKVPFGLDENLLYELLSGIVLIGSNIKVWWKNNSFTKPAMKADEYMKELKYENGDVI